MLKTAIFAVLQAAQISPHRADDEPCVIPGAMVLLPSSCSGKPGYQEGWFEDIEGTPSWAKAKQRLSHWGALCEGEVQLRFPRGGRAIWRQQLLVVAEPGQYRGWFKVPDSCVDRHYAKAGWFQDWEGTPSWEGALARLKQWNDYCGGREVKMVYHGGGYATHDGRLNVVTTPTTEPDLAVIVRRIGGVPLDLNDLQPYTDRLSAYIQEWSLGKAGRFAVFDGGTESRSVRDAEIAEGKRVMDALFNNWDGFRVAQRAGSGAFALDTIDRSSELYRRLESLRGWFDAASGTFDDWVAANGISDADKWTIYNGTLRFGGGPSQVLGAFAIPADLDTTKFKRLVVWFYSDDPAVANRFAGGMTTASYYGMTAADGSALPSEVKALQMGLARSEFVDGSWSSISTALHEIAHVYGAQDHDQDPLELHENYSSLSYTWSVAEDPNTLLGPHRMSDGSGWFTTENLTRDASQLSDLACAMDPAGKYLLELPLTAAGEQIYMERYAGADIYSTRGRNVGGWWPSDYQAHGFVGLWVRPQP